METDIDVAAPRDYITLDHRERLGDLIVQSLELTGSKDSASSLLTMAMTASREMNAYLQPEELLELLGELIKDGRVRTYDGHIYGPKFQAIVPRAAQAAEVLTTDGLPVWFRPHENFFVGNADNQKTLAAVMELERRREQQPKNDADACCFMLEMLVFPAEYGVRQGTDADPDPKRVAHTVLRAFHATWLPSYLLTATSWAEGFGFPASESRRAMISLKSMKGVERREVVIPGTSKTLREYRYTGPLQ